MAMFVWPESLLEEARYAVASVCSSPTNALLEALETIETVDDSFWDAREITKTETGTPA